VTGRAPRLAGRTAIITGATSGIGRATAVVFAAEGARVAIAGRDVHRGREVVDTIERAGGSAMFVRGDVRSNADCAESVARTVAAFGRLDVLVNNAGIYVANDVSACSEEEWDAQVDTSLKGTFLMSKHALPHLVAGGGAIVNVASGWGLVGGMEAAAYCAAKGGVVLLTKAMAIDHGPQGVRVNAVCPGDTETPMEYADAERKGWTWDSYRDWASDRPLGRMGDPDEVARAILFLACDDSSFVTGAALPVDGGGVAG
jgi:NAD(P)-dependent dehydrogenase (short-subunit alcohol dehydrogenase family)